MTTRISMIPNNDVQVIHASQGDTEREWEFELYDNEGLIDTSSIGQQTVYPVYNGGTEEVLPVNTATPSTSPMLADIQYPDQLRLEQYFTYRQCPTASDGKAKVKKLYGNSIVFNQLVQNGNFVDSSGWESNFGTLAVSGGKCTLTVTSKNGNGYLNRGVSLTNGHKYLFMATVKPSRTTTVRFLLSTVASGVKEQAITANQETQYTSIVTATQNYSYLLFYVSVGNVLEVNDTVEFKNIMLIDLTQMGLDITSASEFTDLFPLSYYQYNQGTLLAFNGTDIKTTGKNLCDNNSQVHLLMNAAGVFSDNARCDLYYIPTYLASSFSLRVSDLSKVSDGVTRFGYSNDIPSTTKPGVKIANISVNPSSRTMDQSYKYAVFCFLWVNENDKADIYIGLGDDNTYEPYHEETTPLPIADYFPTGMKSAGTVYDELSESSAVTRIGTRAYQAGDENDPTVITDKTTTYYPLDNPQTVSFVSASFVSQNIETEMTADNGKLYAKSDGYTENAGVFPCKIKVASDGVAYSSEFKLHVERKP